MLWYAVVIILIASPEILNGAPNGEAVPAALAAEPAAVLSTPTGPAVAAVPAAVAPAVATPAVAQDPAGSGIVTEHKNPDGSTITVTRYNGPIPASAFPNPYGGLTGLHDALLQRNLYETQLIQLQTQQAINQAFVRNIHALNYNLSPAYNGYSLTYPSSYFHRTYPLGYTFPTTYTLGQGQGFFPFYGGYNQYNPFFPFPQPAARTVK